ncbi:porphobilinogen deaminase [Nitrococcus mobilis Nb-231]|uniref:Porphobilinogen deaminase n=1 Tax=Nitrococcus mobilis Nb-231 TaxID=314278 RepID=A4BU02_9GAMM|nr:porphobilinogen deaminase [Nitrococcus mobilis Nb-231]
MSNNNVLLIGHEIADVSDRNKLNTAASKAAGA